MLVWLHNFKSTSKLRSELEEETFREQLTKYLERIIKQGYLDNISDVEEDLEVSEISCNHPVDPRKFDDSKDFRKELNDDVNKLVKVANTHSCRATCHKYGNADKCRFEFPRELVQETEIEGNNIKLKRTDQWINNFNPAIMTCVRSNHDVKFVPSGKDGKNIAFYVTNYATKSQLSTHEMVPLIAASKQRVDQETTNSSADVSARAKNMITKCLNRITTETEISGSHVSHFLLGNKDNKTSHKFTGLNLHCALAWLANEIKRYDSICDAVDPDDCDDHDNDNDDDDNNHDNNDDENSASYTISTNDKDEVIFINQMTDYINRGCTLKNMCLYEYVSKVYKNKYTPEDIKKEQDRKKKNRTQRRHEERIKFSKDHPQYETHWQKVRLESSAMVPTLSKLPPSINKNRERHQMCILLLFKPFTSYEELCNASWNETYSEFLEITEYKRYIENIEELHKGIEEREKDSNDETNDDEIADDEGNDDNCEVDEIDTGIDIQTTEALDIIKSTPWLNQSSCNHKAKQNMQPIIEHSSRSSFWTDEMKKQNEDILNDDESAECENQQEPVFNPTPSIATHDDNDIDISIERVGIQDDSDRVQEIVDDTIRKYSLNKKQQKAFEMSIQNVIKRHKKEETRQLIGYIGGPGGTGKSQVIKAIVDFHKKMKLKHTLKLTAHTGTASKHIGGSTCHTLFGYSSTKKNAKTERRFENVETIIVDEVSMIGCRQLAKISKKLTTAKCANKDLPFGGVDMIFFGDFIQFRPVKDTPLYSGWNMKNKTRSKPKKASKKDQSEINKDIGAHLWTQVNDLVVVSLMFSVID